MVKSRIWITLIIVLSGAFGHAQELPPIFKVEKFKKGIYRNVDEFLNDAPSIHREFKIIRRPPLHQEWLLGGEFSLSFEDSTLNRKLLKEIWGVSTGEKILINTSNYGSMLGFEELIGLGRYCYWKGKGTRINNMTSPNDAQPLSIESKYYECIYILNPNNGKIFELTDELMQVILTNDNELLQRFSDEKKKNNDFELHQSYIRQYNASHMGEIDVNPYDVVFYRRRKKESEIPIQLIINDSVYYDIPASKVLEYKIRTPEIKICVDGFCQNFKISITEKNYFECSKPLGKSKSIFRKVESKVGVFYVREIQNYPERHEN